jgi:membrane protease YdiL (CAAX protease family)
MVAAVVFVSRRKGTGDLAHDFGLRLRITDAWWIFAGLLLSVVLGLLVAPLSHIAGGQEQGVVQELNNSTGAKLVVLAVGAGILAPVVEELLFRGLLLRALLRRMPAMQAVAVCGFSFAMVHWILDPRIGTFVAIPALFAMGMISAGIALRTGDLSASIFLHMGFNLLAIIQVVTS